MVAVGTAAAAVPIRSITRLSTNDKFTFQGTSGSEGEESKLLDLAKTMSEIQRGQREDTEGWCWEVTASSSEEYEFEAEQGGGASSTTGDVLPQQATGALSSIGRLAASLYPSSLLGLWAFFVSPAPAAATASLR